MSRRPSGFTLIELLIVIAILGVLAAVLLPTFGDSRALALVAADEMQLRGHGGWLTVYKAQHNGALPPQGGHKFVLSTWSVIDQTPEHLDRYYTPGARDNDTHYQELRLRLLKGEKIWQDLAACTADDTSYCGRARSELRSAEHSGKEALMANSNHGMWSHANGTVNLLLASGLIRSLSYPMLQELYGLGERDLAHPVQTWGKDSPIPECRKLEL